MTTTETTFAPDGKTIAKVTETKKEQGPIAVIMEEMAGKNVAWGYDGWFFGIEMTLTGEETYFPNIRFIGRKAKKWHVSFKDEKLTKEIAEIVKAAMSSDISVEANMQGIKISEDSKQSEIITIPSAQEIYKINTEDKGVSYHEPILPINL